MVDIVPFKGWMFNLEKVGAMNQVVAPPYDVITTSQQSALYEKNPYNIVRLILGQEKSGDNENANRYTRSATTFHEWIENKILIQDARPCFYVYSQEYMFYGNSVRRLGFMARVRLEDFSLGNVCPHEFTLAKAKQDRTQLLQACHANFSPIFGLFSDPGGAIDGKLEEATLGQSLATIEEDGVVHKLWRLEDEKIAGFLSGAFTDKKIYIADGHHRYETALAFHKEHGARVKDSAHVMIFLTNLETPSLAIHPIHRQVRCPHPFKRDEFLSYLCSFFHVEPLPNDITADAIRLLLEEEGKKGIVFVVYLHEGPNHVLLLKLEDTRHILPYLDADDPQELQVLDVAQLHTLVIKNFLKIDPRNPFQQFNLAYTIHIDEGIANVKAGKCDLAFFLNPTRIEQVKWLAEQSIRLPQKSTYFYPKLLSGLVINRFEP